MCKCCLLWTAWTSRVQRALVQPALYAPYACICKRIGYGIIIIPQLDNWQFVHSRKEHHCKCCLLWTAWTSRVQRALVQPALYAPYACIRKSIGYGIIIIPQLDKWQFVHSRKEHHCSSLTPKGPTECMESQVEVSNPPPSTSFWMYSRIFSR